MRHIQAFDRQDTAAWLPLIVSTLRVSSSVVQLVIRMEDMLNSKGKEAHTNWCERGAAA